MSYFDINSEAVKIVVDSSCRMSRTPMKTDKMCNEFVWESGSGYPRIGIWILSSIHIRFNEAGSYNSNGISAKTDTGDSITKAANEPIMICFDKSDTSNYNFTAIKGTMKNTFIFTCSSATQKSEWRILLQNGQGTSSSYSDNVELRLSKKKMTHTIPTEFSPWFGSIGNIRRYSCGRNSSFTKLPFVYIFIVRS